MTPVAAQSSQSTPPDPARIALHKAAQQFEAIFLRQMLAAARKADFGEELFGGQALQTFNTMQDEKFADLAAESGAFGLARQIESQLAAHLGGKAEG
jgi:flagellar protein FlgJ